MSAVKPRPDEAVASYVPALERRRRTRGLGWWLGLAAVLALALFLRLWGLRQGLPYAYNADENSHFLPHAIGMFGHDLDPGYYVNPPAYTYLLHVVLALGYGGRLAVGEVFATDPSQLWTMARAVSAGLGTVAVGLLFLAGRRLAGPAVGLLAAGLLGVAFLPVFYSHLALNDVPTLAPLCLSLWGAAGVLRSGRPIDYAVAGLGLGLAAATKYTGGIVLLALVAAAVPHGRPAIRGLVLAGSVALAAFLVANPYAILDHHAFLDGLSHQSDASREATGKLGLTHESGWLYYLWSFGWGLGWVPLAAAGLALPVLALARRWGLLAILGPAPVLFVAFMGSQERFFGRWLMPVLPFVCLLAAICAAMLVTAATRRAPALRPTLAALVTVALCGQGLVYSLHNGRVLSQQDTRALTRDWLVRNVPAGTRIVVEPGVVPDGWAQDIGHPSPETPNGNRWAKYPTSRSRVDPDTGRLLPAPGVVVNIEDFEKTLRPELIGLFEREGYCWVVVGSTQRGRAEAEPGQVPGAIAYYRELESSSDVAFHASPYGEGKGPVTFNFDWSFNFYPLAYSRPGPEMTVYRLRGGACAT
jgi:4-amino-4-deoxy-L-arabinose transferase-like glycosyltransferase